MQDSAEFMSALPTESEVQARIGQLLRELHLAKRLQRLAKLADQYRDIGQPGRSSATATECPTTAGRSEVAHAGH